MIFDPKQKRVVPYSRYLMEQHLGRTLSPDEEVHHVDFDKTNDVLENLIVLTKEEHLKIHRKSKYQDTIEFCAFCGKPFLVTAKQHRNKFRERNRKPNSVGKYFCSKSCVGKYGKQQQEHQKEKSSE